MINTYIYSSNIKLETKLVPNRVLERFTDGNCTFNILVPVKLTNISGGNLTVREGSSAILFCEATGRPQPNIILSRVLEDGSIDEELQQGPTICWDFLNITRNASGVYRCTADNGFTSESKAFKVNVTCKCIS